MTIKNLAVVFGPTLIQSNTSSNEKDVMKAVQEMQHQIRTLECILDNWIFMFDTPVVLKSTDTVYDDGSDFKLSKRRSESQIPFSHHDDYLKHSKSQSFHDYNRNFGQLMLRDDMQKVKKNRRKQHIVCSSLPTSDEYLLMTSTEILDPSSETVNFAY